MMLVTLLGLSLLLSPSFAESTDDKLNHPFTVSIAEIHRRLAAWASEDTYAGEVRKLTFTSREPGLSVVGATLHKQVLAARKFAGLLHARYGLELVLASDIDGATTPIYSGLIRDAEERVVANFKLGALVATPESAVLSAQTAAEKIRRYAADRTNFARLAFEQTLRAAGLPEDEPLTSLRVTTRRVRNRYLDGVANIRRVVALFQPGRPTWVFLNYKIKTPFSPEEMEALAELTRGGPELAGILIAQPDRWTTVRDGDVASELIAPNCAVDLEVR